MIGVYPVATQLPLDYRYALDAAMTVVAQKSAPVVICTVAELTHEVRQRLPRWSEVGNADVAVWIEPRVDTWQSDLARLTRMLPGDAPLVVIASRPLARLLPERRAWAGQPLGCRIGGITRLARGLARAGFALEARYGIHAPPAAGLSLLGQLMERWGHPELSDRLHFAARLRYCLSGPAAAFATVALFIARKECA